MNCSLNIQVFLIISILISGVLLAIDPSSDVKVYAGIFHEKQNETVTCTIDYTKLTSGKCSASYSPFEKLGIEITKNGITKKLCDFNSFTSCDLVNTSPLALHCGCYNDGQNNYTVNVTVTANKNDHENASFDCKPNCKNSSGYYSLINSYDGMPITFANESSGGDNGSVTCDSKCIGGATAGAVCGTALIAGGAYAGVKKYNSSNNGSSPNNTDETDTDKENQKTNVTEGEVTE